MITKTILNANHNDINVYENKIRKNNNYDNNNSYNNTERM